MMKTKLLRFTALSALLCLGGCIFIENSGNRNTVAPVQKSVVPLTEGHVYAVNCSNKLQQKYRLSKETTQQLCVCVHNGMAQKYGSINKAKENEIRNRREFLRSITPIVNACHKKYLGR